MIYLLKVLVFHIYSGGNHQFEVRKPTPKRPRNEGTKISAQLVNLVHQNHRIRNLPSAEGSTTHLSKGAEQSLKYGSVSRPCTPGEHQNSW